MSENQRKAASLFARAQSAKLTPDQRKARASIAGRSAVLSRKRKREANEAAVAALERIREIGYNSQAHRCTEAMLGVLRIAEEALNLREQC